METPIFKQDIAAINRFFTTHWATGGKVLAPLHTESIEADFFSLFDTQSVAQTHIGSVTIEPTKLIESFRLLTLQQFPMQDNSFQLLMSEFATPHARKPKFEPISISYFDTFDWHYTRLLTQIYEAQFHKETQLLLPDYKSTNLTLQQGLHTRNYHNCALSRPKEQDFTPSAQFLLFTVQFTYSDYNEEIADSASVSAPLTPNAYL